MQTDEYLDANATASELDRFLDGPVQPGDVDAMIEALRSAVPVATPTPDAACSQVAVPTENASEFATSRRNEEPSAGACALNGTVQFLPQLLTSQTYPPLFGSCGNTVDPRRIGIAFSDSFTTA